MNSLRITKPNGTQHVAPIGALQHQLQLNAKLPASMQAMIEEVDDQGKTIAVHHRTAAVETVITQRDQLAAKEAEIAKLKAALESASKKK